MQNQLAWILLIHKSQDGLDSNHQPFITNLRRETAQALKEITLTPEFRLAKGLILRPEYRYDWSDQNSFNSGKNKDQHTIALGVMYTW